MYNEFYVYFEDDWKKWTWDTDIKTKEQGIYVACSLIECIAAFYVLLLLKALVVKLEKRNLDIFKGYYMIDTTIVSDLMDYRSNIDKEFQI